MLSISIMTQRSERWLIVAACLVLYVLAMGAFVLITRQPIQWAVGALNESVGKGWAAVIILIPPLAGGIWAMWPDPSYTPPAANTRFPRWVRVVGNTYLALLGIGLIFGMCALIVAGLYS